MTDQERAARLMDTILDLEAEAISTGDDTASEAAIAAEFAAVRQEEEAKATSHKERLAELAALKPNWDSYGGRQITETAIKTAELLCEEPPQITPCSDGGLQLEWHDRSINFEFRIAPDGTEDDSDYTAAQAEIERLKSALAACEQFRTEDAKP
jgi:hypothetical protein